MIVGDDDLGAIHVVQHIARNQFTTGVIAVRVVGLEHAQTIFDREARRHDEKATRETFALRSAHRVDGLPGDQHRHNRGFSRACGQLQSEAHEFRVGIIVGIREVVQKAFPGLPCLWRDLGQPNDSFHRLHLAEEGPDIAELVMSPMLEQASRLRGDLPLVWMQSAPLVHMLAQFIDDRGGIILLRGG